VVCRDEGVPFPVPISPVWWSWIVFSPWQVVLQMFVFCFFFFFWGGWGTTRGVVVCFVLFQRFLPIGNPQDVLLGNAAISA